jgi:hypothetical protein
MQTRSMPIPSFLIALNIEALWVSPLWFPHHFCIYSVNLQTSALSYTPAFSCTSASPQVNLDTSASFQVSLDVSR